MFENVPGPGLFSPSSRAVELSTWVELMHYDAGGKDPCSPRLLCHGLSLF